MGKGDRRSRKGKVWRHSYGNTRKRKEPEAAFVPKVKKEKKAPVMPQVEEPAEVMTEAAAPKAKKAPAKKKATPTAAAPKKKAAKKKE